MNEKDLPRLTQALGHLYKALYILCKIEGTLKITNILADGTNKLERRINELEYGDE